jgi:hypothetical protein
VAQHRQPELDFKKTLTEKTLTLQEISGYRKLGFTVVGSGSGAAGSVRFWASWIRIQIGNYLLRFKIRIWIRLRLRTVSFHQQAKNYEIPDFSVGEP